MKKPTTGENKEEEIDPNDDEQWIYDKSSCTTKVDDIEGIVYGGTSSWFWLFRKHINSIDKVSELHKLPFFAWDCITLILNHREVDLVIRNESEMKILLQFLIYRMKTLDGNKNSAVQILEALNK